MEVLNFHAFKSLDSFSFLSFFCFKQNFMNKTNPIYWYRIIALSIYNSKVCDVLQIKGMMLY